VAQPLVFGAAAWLFALQATGIGAWNLARAVQPVSRAAAVGMSGGGRAGEVLVRIAGPAERRGRIE
jgi:hypothetical protein